MNLFTALIRRSPFRRPARRTGDSPVPWDADAFPHHTVRRSIELAAMVPGRNGAEPDSSTPRRRRRRAGRRAVLILCAAGGLGLVWLSLAQGARRRPPMPHETGRSRRDAVRPVPPRPRRPVSAVA